MIAIDQARPEVRRMEGLQWYPKDSTVAELELIRAAATASDLAQCRRVIDEIMENEVECPKPATIRALLRPKPQTFAIPPKQTCSHGLCDGSGWQEIHMLITHEPKPNGSVYTRKEHISFDAFLELQHKVDHASQEVYSAVRRCPCGNVQMPMEAV